MDNPNSMSKVLKSVVKTSFGWIITNIKTVREHELSNALTWMEVSRSENLTVWVTSLANSDVEIERAPFPHVDLVN